MDSDGTGRLRRGAGGGPRGRVAARSALAVCGARAAARVRAPEREDAVAARILHRYARAAWLRSAVGVRPTVGGDARAHEQAQLAGADAEPGVRRAALTHRARVAEASVHRAHDAPAIPDRRKAPLARGARRAVAAPHLAWPARRDRLRRGAARAISPGRELDARSTLAIGVDGALASRGRGRAGVRAARAGARPQPSLRPAAARGQRERQRRAEDWPHAGQMGPPSWHDATPDVGSGAQYRLGWLGSAGQSELFRQPPLLG